jgi:hypothetical protein
MQAASSGKVKGAGANVVHVVKFARQVHEKKDRFMADQKVVTEIFNEARVKKCMDVFNKIQANWAKHGFACRVMADEDVKGKTLEELDQMYFRVGVGDDLTALPFLDLLVVFEMIANVNNKRAPVVDNQDGTYSQKLKIKTAFTEAEAFAYIKDISEKIGIEVKPE